MTTVKKIVYFILLTLAPLFSLAQENLSLSDAIRVGLANNYGIKISEKVSEIATTSNSWGMAGALPSISLYGEALVNKEMVSETNTASAQMSAIVDWVLFDGFSIKATKYMLENSEEAAKGNEMLTVENTIHSIINSYYFVLLQQELLTVTKTVFDISKDRLEQERVSKEIGTSGTYEYVQAESNYLDDLGSYEMQKMAFRESLRDLNLLLSASSSKEWRLTEKIEIPKGDYQLASMKDKMLSDNRTLKNQYINLKASEIEIKQQRSALYPTIGLYASMVGGDSNFATSGYNGGFFRPAAGLTLNFNLFNGGKTKRNIDIAEIGKQMEEISTKEIELTLTKELESQLDSYVSWLEQEKRDAKQLDVSTTLLNMSKERYESGTINSFNYRDVQLSYLQSATGRLSTIYNIITINSQLLKITGGILSYGN